ncbi:Spy/CpxP family protein refolding chaperone [Methylobacterium persicinum]|uniref:LTXXQ motif family protein n=1 Tax=Methylobacterium persicinum TaxID=374426 RepID=A0ABU0HTK7_9HYPH|nr:Spy/CpxP family protein refolding chaperone [Methylobacterium persicinum]MDQ0445168.1 hypothetical protein [Methylobacterium persicinum]GJE39080.1 hypothetical protein KHHGKMAE_3159 [Methylobacterium persicinum]
MRKTLVHAGVLLALAAVPTFALAENSPDKERLATIIKAESQFLTDQRVEIVKAALQLRPDQTQYWPAIEQAIRNRAKGREARVTAASERLSDLSEKGAIEALQNRDPVAFLQRRSANLAQRSTELKNLADAWQPLYQSLSQDQKRRLAILTIFVVHEMRDRFEQRRMEDEEDSEG